MTSHFGGAPALASPGPYSQLAYSSVQPSLQHQRTSLEDDTRRSTRVDLGAAKADQIVQAELTAAADPPFAQHFYSKTCTIVTQSRMTHLQTDEGGLSSSIPSSTAGAKRSPLPASGATARKASTPTERTKSVHKWFNIELADSDVFRNELKTWRSVSALYSHTNSPSSSSHPTLITDPPVVTAVPPMILDVLLDTQEMLPNQVLVLSDHRGRRVRVDPTFAKASRRTSNTSLPPSGVRSPLATGPSGGGVRPHATSAPATVVLERWTLSLTPHPSTSLHPSPSSASPVPTTADLPAVYKRAIVHFRALYSTARVLPSWNLHRRLARRRAGNGVVGGGVLMIGCRMSMSEQEMSNEEGKEGEVSLDTPISEGEGEQVTETIDFPVVATPIGGLKLMCTYRINAEFAVEDIETLLSSRFIDEDFFKPTMARYQQDPAFAAMDRPGSLPTSAKNRTLISPSTSPPMTGFAPKPSYGSLSSRHHLTSAPVAISPSNGAVITQASTASSQREGSASSSGKLSVSGSSTGMGCHAVEPAFISLSRTRGASYSSQIQRATNGGTAAQQIQGSSSLRRPSFTTSNSSPVSSSPIFRASSYLSSPPLPQHALSSSPSTGPTSNIHRSGGQSSTNTPSSLGLGFARQQQYYQQEVGFVPAPSSGAGASSGTVTTGSTPMNMVARSPLSGATQTAPRPIPSPSSAIAMPRYSSGGGSYSRSYGRGSSGPGSYGSLTGGALTGDQWGERRSPLTATGQAQARTPFGASEPDPKKFLETAEDDSDDINAFLGMIDSRPELLKASMIASKASPSGSGGPGADNGGELSTRSQVDEQLRALRGSVYVNLGAVGASPPLGGGSAASAGLGLSTSGGPGGNRTSSMSSSRRQTSRQAIEEEPSQTGPPLGEGRRDSTTARHSSVDQVLRPMPNTPRYPAPGTASITATTTMTSVTFPQYTPNSSRTRKPIPAVTTTGFDLTSHIPAAFASSRASPAIPALEGPPSGTGSMTVAPYDSPNTNTGHSSVTSFNSVRSSTSGYTAEEEEAVGRLELGDPDDEPPQPQEGGYNRRSSSREIEEENAGNRGRHGHARETPVAHTPAGTQWTLHNPSGAAAGSRDPTPAGRLTGTTTTIASLPHQTAIFSTTSHGARTGQEDEEAVLPDVEVEEQPARSPGEAPWMD
ncbi:BQ5605_C037g11588 [Microbotryum silenes-dioicae]|uniref:Autophagy-related protein 13 n=1 Tax=Microbotryum silenes-dioicae TaxID=796604 RepID=A0A2X0PGV7_9BASI|nr:BQ5605_C037g11588 [Microbotryum silenes-dioicae]